MSDTSAAPVAETSRRRLLAWLGAGGAAALATLFTREAKAGHDGTGTLHLGEANHNPPGSSTRLDGSGGEPTFSVLNDAGRGPAFGVGGTAHFGAHVGDGSVVTVNNHDAGSGAAGLGVFVLGEEPAISGIVTGLGGGTGVRGESLGGTGVEGVHAGPDFGIGVEGVASPDGESGVGVVGRGGHVGVSGESLGGEAGVKGIGGQVDDAGVPFGTAAGVVGKSFTSVGVRAETESPDQPAILGEGRTAIEREGELGSAPGVVGRSGTGTGVRGESLTGFGLEVIGRAGLSTAGSAVVPAGHDSAFVANPDVTADSHVAVTLASDPGRRALRWVERAPGAGFTVHLTAPAREAIALTYSIVEPI